MSQEDELRALFKKFSDAPYCKFMGIELLELRRGYSKVAMTVRDEMVNFHRVAHGGAILSVADAAFAAASNSHNKVAMALSITINYRHTVASGTRLIAEAVEESLGKTTALYRMTVTTDDGKLVAVCQGLVYRWEKALV